MTDTATPASPRTNPWVVFILPLAVYMIANSFEPAPPAPLDNYPLIYAAKIALTVAAIIFVWPGYRQFMPIRFGFLSILVGVAGVVLWVGLWHVDLEAQLGLRELMAKVGLASRRSAFNPFAELESSAQAWGFMALRLFGLALVVPLIEEMFYRGFVMRFVIDREWPNVPIGKVTPLAAAAAIVLPVLMHPAEVFAAAAWFGLMVWLYWKTKNIWDCVVAHITTNALLGAYVLASSNPAAWQLL